MARFFFPGGANSAAIAPVVPASAPTPRPVMKRQTPKAASVSVIADTAMPIENQAMAPIMTLRRPIRSPRVPATRAPSIMPIIAYEPSMPASFGVSAWSPIHLAESGPMKPGRTAP